MASDIRNAFGNSNESPVFSSFLVKHLSARSDVKSLQMQGWCVAFFYNEKNNKCGYQVG